MDQLTHAELKQLHSRMRPKIDSLPAIGNRGYKKEVKARIVKFLKENQKLAQGEQEIVVCVPEQPAHP